MAYTDIPDTDVDVDSPLDEDLLEDLRDNDNFLRETVFGAEIAEASTASATYVTLASFDVYLQDLPDYTGIQRSLTVRLEVKTTSGTATYKVTDNDAAVDSTEDTTTSAGYEAIEVTLNFAAGLAGTTRTIDIKGKTSAGTASAKIEDACTNRINY